MHWVRNLAPAQSIVLACFDTFAKTLCIPCLTSINAACANLLAFLICCRLLLASFKSACLIVIVLYTFTRFFFVGAKASSLTSSFCASFGVSSPLSFLTLSFCFFFFLAQPRHFAAVIYGQSAQVNFVQQRSVESVINAHPTCERYTFCNGEWRERRKKKLML